MQAASATLWWVAAGLAVAVELGTGTFYLLMVALGFVAAALTAHLGGGTAWQLAAAAVVGGGATAAWHWRRGSHAAGPPARENRDVNLDIGERVRVGAWGADGTARVSYRGSSWRARLQTGAPVRGGEHVVAAVEGNWLVLAPVLDAVHA